MFFLSCKASAKAKPAETGHGPHTSKIFVFFYVFVLCRSMYGVCKCVLYYCHRVATQLQVTNVYQFFLKGQFSIRLIAQVQNHK